jgi:hypothetical protein
LQSSRYRFAVGNSQDPLGRVAGVASGAAPFWLRTSIRTQEQLMGWLGDQSEEPSPESPPQTATKAPQTDALGSKMR